MRWDTPAPGERDAESRSWQVVRDAWSARDRVPRRRLVRRGPLVAFAAAIAVAAAALSPAGKAVLGSIRDAVGTSTDRIVSLPVHGRVLFNAPAGAWIVHDDGSKRFLAGYADAAWSPHGLYLAAARRNDLVALEPNGRVHWKLARPAPVAAPQWSYEGFRIAYLSGRQLRVVNGDGTGDRLISGNVVGTGLPAFAWRPDTHELAYADGRGGIVLRDVDGARVLWRRRTGNVTRLLWSAGGTRLFVGTEPRPLVVDAHGAPVARPAAGGTVVAAGFAPRSDVLALAVDLRGRSTLELFSGRGYTRRRTVFAGVGVFAGLAWSPDARWLLVDWSSADQWVLVRLAPTPRVRTISNVNATFGTGPEHFGALAGWCCP